MLSIIGWEKRIAEKKIYVRKKQNICSSLYTCPIPIVCQDMAILAQALLWTPSSLTTIPAQALSPLCTTTVYPHMNVRIPMETKRYGEIIRK